MHKGTLIKTIGTGVAWVTVFNALTKLFAFGASVYVLSHLSLAEFGLSELVFSLASMAGLFMLPGLNQTVISDVGVEVGNKNFPAARKILRDYFNLRMILAVTIFIVFIGASYFVDSHFTPNVIAAIRIYALTFLIAPIRSMASIVFSVFKNFFLQGMLLFTEEFFRLICIFAFFTFTNARLEAVFMSLVLGQAFSTLFFLKKYMAYGAMLSGGESIFTGGRFAFLNILLAHGKWATFSSYFNNLGQNIRLWVIKLVLGTEAVGIFSFAYALLSHVLSLFTLTGVVTPILAENSNNPERFKKVLIKSFKYQTLAFLVLAIGALIAGQYVVGIFYPKYMASLPVFYVMLIALPISGFAAVVNTLFFIMKMQKQLFFSIGIKNISVLVFSLIGASTFGIIGIGVEYILSVTVFVVERFRVIRKSLPGIDLSLREIFAFDDVDRLLLNKLRMRFMPNYKKLQQ